jgi:hippurate hydrolase
MPAEIEITGTMRCFNGRVQAIIDSKMESLAHALAAANGCTAEVKLKWGTTALVNHDENTDTAIAAASAIVGAGAVQSNTPPITGGEDFCFMLEKKPGAFIFVGNGIAENGKTPGLHTPLFNFNDETTPIGVAYWVELVKQELNLKA